MKMLSECRAIHAVGVGHSLQMFELNLSMLACGKSEFNGEK